MSNKPVIRKMFPGAVTYQGFYSYYNYMIEPNARHIYVIKGGPGVGKSTFMKKIGKEMVAAGYDIELHCCSSDNNSIDGLVIPALGVALLDGTAPHVVDPKNPGAVDEIINLGEYWNEPMIHQNKNEILSCNRQISRHFQAAYFSLKEAKNAMDEMEFYIEPYQDWNKINHDLLTVEKDLFKTLPRGNGKMRHLFAWGHTPQGRIQFIDSLLQGIKTLYILSGHPGTGKSTFLTKIADRALMLGQSIEAYHSTLEPEKLDLVILPELEAALVVSSEQYHYTPEFDGKIISLDFDVSLDVTGLKPFVDDIISCRERINKSLERAHLNSMRAKNLHDLLETYYIPAMNFAAIEKKRIAVLQNILNMAEGVAATVDSGASPSQEV
jgi:hypothetical protein